MAKPSDVRVDFVLVDRGNCVHLIAWSAQARAYVEKRIVNPIWRGRGVVLSKFQAFAMLDHIHNTLHMNVIPLELYEQYLAESKRLRSLPPKFIRGDFVRYRDSPKIGRVKWSQWENTAVMYPGEQNPLIIPTEQLVKEP